MTDIARERSTTRRTRPSARREMHELGNVITALQFCLQQLDGHQRSDELGEVVRRGLELCEQGMAAFHKVGEVLSAHH